MTRSVALAVALYGLLLGCSGAGPQTSLDARFAGEAGPDTWDARVVDARPDGTDAGPSRSFAMGFTTWPYSFTKEGWTSTLASIRAHAELVAFHEDHGVPWQEAAGNVAFDPNVEQTLAEQADARDGFAWTYVSATAQGPDRRTLAGHWGAKDHEPLPPEWANKHFSDPEVIDAYSNYLRRLVETLQPDFLAYGIEVNANYTPEDPLFSDFLSFCEAVYESMKSEYPTLTVFLTFQTDSWEVSPEEQEEVTRRLSAYTDVMALSTYPYVTRRAASARTAEGLPPADWLDRWAALAPGKPLAISETGFAAEDLEIPEYGFDIHSTPEFQEAYVRRLLEDADRLGALFVIWWEIRDYDQGYQELRDLGLATPDLLIWKDIGLLDGAGSPRPALHVWDDWFARPVMRH